MSRRSGPDEAWQLGLRVLQGLMEGVTPFAYPTTGAQAMLPVLEEGAQPMLPVLEEGAQPMLPVLEEGAQRLSRNPAREDTL